MASLDNQQDSSMQVDSSVYENNEKGRGQIKNNQSGSNVSGLSKSNKWTHKYRFTEDQETGQRADAEANDH